MNGYDSYQVNQMIAENGIRKAAFEELILRVRVDLKKQISGK
jgi:hypothetical protein